MTDAMSEELLELGEMIALAQPDAVVSHHVTHGELTVVATPTLPHGSSDCTDQSGTRLKQISASPPDLILRRPCLQRFR